jgi:hypothetical protein
VFDIERGWHPTTSFTFSAPAIDMSEDDNAYKISAELPDLDAKDVDDTLILKAADLLPGWRHFTTAQNFDHLIGLDRCYEIPSWEPYTELDPFRRSFRMQVLPVFLSIGVKLSLNGALEHNVGPRSATAPVAELQLGAVNIRDKVLNEQLLYPLPGQIRARCLGARRSRSGWC